ncbi:MAG: class II aldolase/adducin family protein [Alphaproteobacteria bacterium]|nr:class II aldolase/adducin family protein [Alphaproteobacteria bacterium]
MGKEKAAALRRGVAWLYREVCTRGLNVGSSGNVSARLGEGMLITPTGVRGDTVDEADLVRMDFAGAHRGRIAPSSEWQMHAEIYRADPRAEVIVHTHADCCTALGALGRNLPAFHYDIAQFGGDDVRLAPYALFGTAELAGHAVAALEGRTACLLANHGMLCHGRDAASALLAAVRLETMARQYLLALAVGEPHILGAEAMAAVRERYKTYGQQPERRTT